MQDWIQASSQPERRWLWRGGALALILAVSVFHVIYLAIWCPLDLVPDEAHYWDWSRHLDWNYYSKGPLVAWLIRGSCDVFGEWSVSLTGTQALAVRLPAVLCGALMLASLYVLTAQVWKRERLAFIVVALALTTPVVSAASILMTIDSPYLCLWGWALVTGHCAVVQNRSWAWPVTGLLIALGILAKYTMALWVVSAGLFLLFTPEYRSLLWRRGFWIMSATANLASLPVLWWNSQNGWVTFRHVATQAGVSMPEGAGAKWFGPLEYLGGQFALLLGFWFVAWAGAMIVFRPQRTTDPGVRYLWWMSIPTFALFGLVTFKAKAQVNWPAAAYLSGMVLAAVWLERQIVAPSRVWRWVVRGSLGFTCALGLMLCAVLHDSSFIRPTATKIVGPPTTQNPFPLRKVDPSCRLRGWRWLAGEIDQMRSEIAAEEGHDPVLTGISWMVPGELGFYCAGQPQAYSLGPVMGDRHSQYDLWRPNPIDDAQVFLGRTFIVVGQGLFDQKPAAFNQPVTIRHLVYREGEHQIAGWTVWICRDFQGFRPEALRSIKRGY